MYRLSIQSAIVLCMARHFLVACCFVSIPSIGIGETTTPETLHQVRTAASDVPGRPFPITIAPTHGMMQGGNLVFVDVGERAGNPSTLPISVQFGDSPTEACVFDEKTSQHACKAPQHAIPEAVNVTVKVDGESFDMGRIYTYTTYGKEDIPIIKINTSILQDNIKRVKATVPPGVLLGAVLKNGDPVGFFGTVFTEAVDVDYFFVPELQDAIDLREAGVRAPIAIMYLSKTEDIPLMLYYDLEPAASSFTWVQQADQVLSKTKGRLNVHLWVDTGMGREGVMPDEALPLARSIQSSQHLKLKGIATHFCCIDPKDLGDIKRSNAQNETVQQKLRFDDVVQKIRSEGIGLDAIIHAGASDVLRYDLKPLYYDLLRIGSLLFESEPARGYTYVWKTLVQQVKTLPKGWCIDYECVTRTKKATKVGLISHVPSDDSIKFYIWNKEAKVLLNHDTVIVLDLSDIPDAQEGEEVAIHFDPSMHYLLDSALPVPVALQNR